jgi:hypothetical protein
VTTAAELAVNSLLRRAFGWLSDNKISSDCAEEVTFSELLKGTLIAAGTAGKGLAKVRCATEVWSGCAVNDRTAPPPTATPIAVATAAVRSVRMKLGAGERHPHSG